MERGAAHFEKFFDKILEYHFGTKITTAALEFLRKLNETYFSVVTYLPLKFSAPSTSLKISLLKIGRPLHLKISLLKICRPLHLLKNLIDQNLPPPPPPKNFIAQNWPPPPPSKNSIAQNWPPPPHPNQYTAQVVLGRGDNRATFNFLPELFSEGSKAVK